MCAAQEDSSTPRPKSARPYDVVLFGATGFTGTLTAEYFAANVPLSQVRWTIAGRNLDKLMSLRARLSTIAPECADITPIMASSDDRQALEDMAKSTRVILTTVGPFAEYGEPLVAACVTHGTDYVDITGEPDFWNGIIDRYHDRAIVAGSLIIPCCGFDSIPHDLGALFCAQQLHERGSGPIHVDGYVAAKGSVSGGTWQSLVRYLGKMRKRVKRRSSGKRRGPRSRGIHFSPAVRRWVAPAPTIDPAVVRRSAKLVPDAFGGDFSYHHYMQTKNFAQMVSLVAGVGSIAALAQIGPTRRLLLRMRTSGDGPNRSQRERNWFKVVFVGTRGHERVVTRVCGGDPGYGETSKMLAESALTLVHARDQLPLQGGVVTPASALGTHLITRLQTAGIVFEVLD